MAESSVNVTEGSGKKLHTDTKSIGGNTVHDEVVLLGEQYLAAYSVAFAQPSIGTANDHVIQLMAGANNKLRIRRIVIQQRALGGSAGRFDFVVLRLTTAGSGGGSITPAPFDTADAAAGATSQTLPSSKGTESTTLITGSLPIAGANPIQSDPFKWEQLPNQKPIIVPAGTSNGIAIKVIQEVTSASVRGWIEFDESSF